MPATLAAVVEVLRNHEPELRSRGVRHAAVFGSVARGDPRADSDVDVMVELDPEQPVGIFEYARLKLRIAELIGDDTDVVNRKTLKPLIRESVLRDAVNVF